MAPRRIDRHHHAGLLHAFDFGDAIQGRNPRRRRAGVSNLVDRPGFNWLHRRVINRFGPILVESNAKTGAAAGKKPVSFFKAFALSGPDQALSKTLQLWLLHVGFNFVSENVTTILFEN